ncbi:hypothetical protein GCM10011505_51030 [Tistrella bauzanensis]|uniref:Uncharacterized protein n=1 Tax=Tistrella bauzanensis TaxID=657419 RepID=A0ABQ1JEM4_9PROT|nr:hypothetical protein GCM10011505_51030 [Tistrella bauzanensis]
MTVCRTPVRLSDVFPVISTFTVPVSGSDIASFRLPKSLNGFPRPPFVPVDFNGRKDYAPKDDQRECHDEERRWQHREQRSLITRRW